MTNIDHEKFYSKRIGNALIILRNGAAPLSGFHFMRDGVHCISVHTGLLKKERTAIIRRYLSNPPKREFDLAGFRRLQEEMLSS